MSPAPQSMPRSFTVSAIIPLHNKVDQIRATLKSVINQDFLAAEIIVIDDGSTDGSIASIHDLVEGKVRLLYQSNQGPGVTRNHGAAEATGDWLAFLDADDLWRPNHLSSLARLHAAFPHANVLVSNHDRATHGEPMNLESPTCSSDSGRILDFMNDPKCHARVNSSVIAIRRVVFEGHGGFATFCPGEDTDLWFRLGLDTVFAISECPTVIIVRGTGGIMDQFDNRQRLGFQLPELFETIDGAITGARTPSDAQCIRNYRDVLLRRSIIQALYRGESDVARILFKSMNGTTLPRDIFLRLLSWLPAGVVRQIVRLRSILS